MKLNIIEGKKGCQEIEVELDYNNIDGITGSKDFRTIYLSNKKKYRLTLNSYKELVKELKSKSLYKKLEV